MEGSQVWQIGADTLEQARMRFVICQELASVREILENDLQREIVEVGKAVFFIQARECRTHRWLNGVISQSR